MTFCFKCKACGYTTQQAVREPAPTCNNEHQEVVMIRDYRTESSNVFTFTNALGDGKVGTRVVKPEDNVSRTGT
jgi:hypothetical protein